MGSAIFSGADDDVAAQAFPGDGTVAVISFAVCAVVIALIFLLLVVVGRRRKQRRSGAEKGAKNPDLESQSE